MKPYYESGGVTLYHADARHILKNLPPIDIVVCDPPYGIDYRSNHRVKRHDAIEGDGTWPSDLVTEAVALSSRASYIFCRWDQLPMVDPPKSVLAWVKNNWSMGDLRHEHGRQWEAICFYPGPRHEFIRRIPDVIHADKTGNNLHPTEKPVGVARALIACNVGDVVLDFCAGSGSFLVAAKEEGRKAIGVEINERYCEIAARRLDQGVLDFGGAL